MAGLPAILSGAPRLWRGLRLASKFNLTLALVGIVGLAAAAWALGQTIRPAFDGLERASVGQQVDRARALLQSRLTSIEDSSRDYAVWDDSYDYVATRDPAFESENLTTLLLVNVNANAMAYARLDGDLLHARYVNLEDEVDLPDLGGLFGKLVTSDRILALARSHRSFADFAVIDGRVIALGGAQVVRSDESGAPTGYVVMARELANTDMSAALQVATTVSTDIATELMVRGPDTWRIALPIVSLDGAPVGSVVFEAPRDTSKLGDATILAALGATALAIALALATVYFIVRGFVVRRLSRIDGHMRKVTDTGELAPLDPDLSLDELGSVGRSFNAMVAELKELREQIEVQSYQLGQSESAAGAMHNVRNSLNPVTVILSQALSEQAAASAQNVTQALSELSSDETAPARRQRLAAFLGAAFDDVDKRAASRRDAFMTAKASLAEALEILRSQSENAHKEIPIERFDILDVIRRNAALTRFAPWGEIGMDLPEQGMMVKANRLLMSQVIANLMTNAVESIIAADRRPGRLAISLTRVAEADGEMAAIMIADDGLGFEPEMAKQLFERGHSSKTHRSGGLGLHWCANTIGAMGGSLALESTGPGMGARAIIRLRACHDVAPGTAEWPSRAA